MGPRGIPGESRGMATEPQHTAPDFDMAPHMAMWNRFCKMTLYGIIAVAIVLAGMAYFLT